MGLDLRHGCMDNGTFPVVEPSEHARDSRTTAGADALLLVQLSQGNSVVFLVRSRGELKLLVSHTSLYCKCMASIPSTRDHEQPPPHAEPDDIFYQIDQECKFIEEELASYANQDPDKKDHPFPQQQIEALLQLKQFSPLFREAYKELLSRLPISISLRSRNAELGVPVMTSPVDIPSTHYVRTRCVFSATDLCETWTFKPYVIDTYLLGLSGILGAGADTSLEGDELEAKLAAGYKLMCCSGHEEAMKEQQASAFAVLGRPVVEKWREDEKTWRSVGKAYGMQTKM